MSYLPLPVLVPLPIPTRGLPWYKAYFNWLFYSREYVLGEDWYGRLPTGEDVFIAKGFHFNGASVPKLFWFLLSPTGILLVPSLLHDHAFGHQCLYAPDGSIAVRYNRREADAMFHEVCHVVNGLVVLDMLVAAILSCTSWYGWRKNRKRDKANG